MRILLATESFYPAVDSTTTTLKATADRLLDQGHQVQIIAPGPGLASYRGCPVARGGQRLVASGHRPEPRRDAHRLRGACDLDAAVEANLANPAWLIEIVVVAAQR